MTIQIPPCGPHCGTASGRTGHCDCELCHDGVDLITIEAARSERPERPGPARASMCDQWYAGIGSYRPWHAGEHAVPDDVPDVRNVTGPAEHDQRCDRDLCHPDCPVRRRAELDDTPRRRRMVW